MAYINVGNRPGLFSEGVVADPSSATLLADTTALDGGEYEVRLLLGAETSCVFTVQRRNAANDASVGDDVIIYSSGPTAQYIVLYEVFTNERIRVVAGAAVTGDVYAAIQIERVT